MEQIRDGFVELKRKPHFDKTDIQKLTDKKDHIDREVAAFSAEVKKLNNAKASVEKRINFMITDHNYSEYKRLYLQWHSYAKELNEIRGERCEIGPVCLTVVKVIIVIQKT